MCRVTNENAPKQSIWRRAKSVFGLSVPHPMVSLDTIYPSQEDLNEDVEFNRAVADDMISDYSSTAQKMREVSAELSKWILTSLLAVNSGGLIAIGQLTFRQSLQGVAAGCFTIGLLLPLFAAHLSIRSGILLAFPVGEAIGYWGAVRTNGYRDRPLELEHMQLGQKALEHAKWPYRLGYASILLFVAGVATAAIGLIAR